MYDVIDDRQLSLESACLKYDELKEKSSNLSWIEWFQKCDDNVSFKECQSNVEKVRDGILVSFSQSSMDGKFRIGRL